MSMILGNKYKIKNITDLCSGNGLQNPEFRIPEIKASMRFWWRALNFFNNSKEMKVKEEEIFGGSGKITCKSPLVFKLGEKNNFKVSDNKHIVKRDCNKEYTISCFKSGKTIDIELEFKKRKIDNNSFLCKGLEFYDSLFRISLILGGIGKRSRRGCGVFNIANEEDKSNIVYKIEKYMKSLDVDKYYVFENENFSFFKIYRKEEFKRKSGEYPYIEEILIDLNAIEEEEFYKKIKEAIDKAREGKLKYKNIGRLACPIYVTCYGEKDMLYPIIVKLHNTELIEEDKILNRKYNDYYKVFKDVILCKRK